MGPARRVQGDPNRTKLVGIQRRLDAPEQRPLLVAHVISQLLAESVEGRRVNARIGLEIADPPPNIDVLDEHDEIRIATGYTIDGKPVSAVPARAEAKAICGSYLAWACGPAVGAGEFAPCLRNFGPIFVKILFESGLAELVDVATLRGLAQAQP